MIVSRAWPRTLVNEDFHYLPRHRVLQRGLRRASVLKVTFHGVAGAPHPWLEHGAGPHVVAHFNPTVSVEHGGHYVDEDVW